MGERVDGWVGGWWVGERVDGWVGGSWVGDRVAGWVRDWVSGWCVWVGGRLGG